MKDEQKPIRDEEQKPDERTHPRHERAMDDPGRGHGDPMDDLLSNEKDEKPAR